MIRIAIQYYKNLFITEDKLNVHLSDTFWNLEEMVSRAQNGYLEVVFTHEEIKNAVFGSYAEGAPGPHGFPFLFYQKFWDLIKQYISNMFIDWQAGKLALFRLNFSLLTLISKDPDAITIQKYRLIDLTNCSFKIFSKCVTNRLGEISDSLIATNQTTFIRGRFILESVVSAHEIIHDVV
jgi:hypothetical protein